MLEGEQRISEDIKQRPSQPRGGGVLPSSLIFTYLRTATCLRHAFWMTRA